MLSQNFKVLGLNGVVRSEGDRHTDRQTDRQTGRQTDTQTDIQAGIHT